MVNSLTVEYVMRIATVCSMFLAFASSAFATPITFIHTGSGSGTIGGNAFSDASFAITSTGDTENISSVLTGFTIGHDSSSIAISGVGTYSITTGTRTFVSNEFSIVGYSRSVAAGEGDLYDGPTDAVFATWDMLSSIGPVTGNAEIIAPQWDDEPPIETDGGTLSFERATGVATFEAIIPEPATWTILLGCLAALVARHRRRP